ncbi:hypothetical protein [Rhodococcus ruber]|uniref:hypothetical protein n=1 Tax=Rhodococcus ruber TaxID=1830 RepID=UPI00034D0DED|nr:hypothetical protein [Rhodococcus ruber]
MSTLEFALAVLLAFQSVAWIATDLADSAPRPTARDRFGEEIQESMRRRHRRP